MTDEHNIPEVIEISRETLVEMAKAAYNKGREDGQLSADSEVISEARLTGTPEETATIEAMLDRAFEPLRRQLEGATTIIDEPQ